MSKLFPKKKLPLKLLIFERPENIIILISGLPYDFKNIQVPMIETSESITRNSPR